MKVPTARANQAGFTLIELSIVLVIIGLIVGGVVKGQELVNSARVKSQVAQIDAVRVAGTTFQDRFGLMPGDYNTATDIEATLTNGNGNGTVDGGALAAAGAGESVQFWRHLAASNMINGVTVAGTDVLPAKFDGARVTVFNGASTAGRISLWATVYRGTPAGAPAAAPALLSGADAGSIDRRYDDGSPTTGSIQTVEAGADGNCSTSNTAYSGGTDAACRLSFDLE